MIQMLNLTVKTRGALSNSALSELFNNALKDTCVEVLQTSDSRLLKDTKFLLQCLEGIDIDDTDDFNRIEEIKYTVKGLS